MKKILHIIPWFLVLYLSLYLITEKDCVVGINDGYVLVTAKHIDSNSLAQYKRIYTEDDVDVAIYVKRDYTPKLPRAGVIVTSADSKITGTVISTDRYGFVFKPDDVNVIQKGVSGTKMFNEDGKYLGFISYQNESKDVYCLAY